MSKKEDFKKQGKMSVYTEKQKKKKTAVIVAVAAAIVAAVVLLSVFVIAPWVRERKYQPKPPVTHGINTVDPQQGEKYEYVEYRGLRMPKQVAEILNQAEIDNAEACEKYGVAATVGSYQISRPKFEMHYNYVYAEKVSESIYYDRTGQMNTSGFDYNLSPEEQRYPGGNDQEYKWSDRFTDLALQDLQYYYAAFEYAVENKIRLEESDFQRMIYEYEDIKTGAENKGITLDEYLLAGVGEHVTYEMYAAHGIMKYYAAEFQETEMEKYKQAVTQAQIEDYHKKNETDLKLAKIRIYPIETEEYDEKELAKVKDEATFLDYAQKTNVYGEGYDAKTVTEFWWVDRNTVSSKFGEAVGEWAFDKSRVKGEVALVQGTLYNCLVYIDTPAYETATHQVLICEYPNVYKADEATIEDNKKNADLVQAHYVDNGKTKEALQDIIDEGYFEDKAVSISDYGIEIDKWVFDSSRKEGDYVRIDNTDGSYFIYYLHENPEDYDWIRAARASLGMEAYDKAFSERVQKDFNAERASEKSISDAWKHAYEIMEPYVEERRQMYGLK